MTLKHITIKKLLSLGAVFITFLLLLIGGITGYFINDTFHEFRLISTIKEIQNKELEVRKAEKEYLSNETKNPDYFTTGKSKYLVEIDTNLQEIRALLINLKQSKTIEELQLSDQIDQMNDYFKLYKSQINNLSDLELEKGFKDWGIEGKMRDQIHAVEDETKKHANSEYGILMLTLRRHEKDYLLRKDLAYLDKFNDVIATFEQKIKSNHRPEEQYLIELLDTYQKLFNQLIHTDVQIGLTPNNGLLAQLNGSIDHVETNLSGLARKADLVAKKKINRTLITLFTFIALLSIILIFSVVGVSNNILKSINNLRSYISRLGKGELPEEIPVYNNDEIAHMKRSINDLTVNLKNTKDFAIAVGNGNFDTEVNVFGNQGDLGSALVEMRQKLIQVAQERENQNKEANQRLWANEGFQLIHQILSSNQELNQAFYNTLIAKLTQYLKANQGTFLLAEEENGEILLVQKGTYAYDRNRINIKKLKIGEGLIGAVAFERKSTYMTHLPKNYINITSGLGDAPPTAVLIVPCLSEDELLGIIELASFNSIEPYQIEFTERVAADIAYNIRKMKIEETTRELLEKTQSQASELVEKEEEMRQNLEELKTTQESMQSRETELLAQIHKLTAQNDELKQVIENIEGNNNEDILKKKIVYQ